MICGRAPSSGHDGAWPTKKLEKPSSGVTRSATSVRARQRFPRIENWNRDGFQALEKLAVSVSNAWGSVATWLSRPLPACPAGAKVQWLQALAAELFRQPREAAQQNSPGEFCLCKISTTANRQSAFGNRKFF